MSCKSCNKNIRWMEEFPGGICVDCHRKKVEGQSAEEDYKNIVGGFGASAVRVNRIQELRRSNAASAVPSKKAYKRKPKYPPKND